MEQRGKRVKTEAGSEISVSIQAGDSEVKKWRLGADLIQKWGAEDDCFLA